MGKYVVYIAMPGYMPNEVPDLCDNLQEAKDLAKSLREMYDEDQFHVETPLRAIKASTMGYGDIYGCWDSGEYIYIGIAVD